MLVGRPGDAYLRQMGSGRATAPAHRIAGAVALLGAVGLALILTHSASFPIAGTAVAGWPQPPAVGSCASLTDGSSLAVVACSDAHQLEITQAFPATMELPKNITAQCEAAAAAYVGPTAGSSAVAIAGWTPEELHYSAYQWDAPAADVVGGHGWRVCVIAPWRPGLYVGSVRNLGSPADRPAAYGLCASAAADQTSPQLVRCDQPHQWEQLGTQTVDAAGLSPQQQAEQTGSLLPGCSALAAVLTGSPDPTFGGALLPSVLGPGLATVTSGGSGGPGAPVFSTPYVVATSTAEASTPGERSHRVAAQCRVGVEGSDPLTGSVMALGDKPLPLE